MNRLLSVAAILSALGVIGTLLAQNATPLQKRATQEQAVERLRGLALQQALNDAQRRLEKEVILRDMEVTQNAGRGGAGVSHCALADGTSRRIDTPLTLNGVTNRCVAVLDDKVQRSGVAWAPLSEQGASSD